MIVQDNGYDAKKKQFLENYLIQQVPLARILKIEAIAFTSQEIILKIPYHDQLTFTKGIPHGGVLTTLMDHTMGIAVVNAMDNPVPMVTLDLRLDYNRVADHYADLYCKAQCYRQSNDVLFTRGTIYNDDETNPVCYGVGIFMKANI